MSIIADSYSEANQNYFYGIYTSTEYGLRAVGESFTGKWGILDKVTFYLQRFGNPTGLLTASIYAHSGTFGSTGIPTGSPLATSDTVNCSTVDTSAFELIDFTFTGANKMKLQNGVKYVVTVTHASGTSYHLDYIRVGSGSNTHSGNSSQYSSSWTVLNVNDKFCFYVYIDPLSPFPMHLS